MESRWSPLIGRQVYRDPLAPAPGPASRLSSASEAITRPLVRLQGEPMLQAVRNPFVEEVDIVR